MISKLQQQAQGFENYRERGQQAMDNFDTDKAIQQGTEIAYRHGTALLNQGREQLEAMAGTEIVAGAHMAIPAIVKTAQAVSKYRGQVADAQQTNQFNQRLANIRADTDQKPLPTDEEYGLPDLDGAPSGAPQGYFGQVQARGDDGGRTLKYNPRTGGVETETGEPAQFGEARFNTTRTKLEQESFENPNANQQRIGTPSDRVDYGDVDFSTRGATATANQQFRASAPKPSDLELPDIAGYTDPNVSGVRTGASQPGVARPIEPQVNRPTFDPTAPVAGEAPRPANPQQYPASRGPAQAPRAPRAPKATLPEPVDYTEGQTITAPEVSSTADTSAQVSKGIGVVSQDIPTIAPKTGGIPGVNFGGQTTTAPTPVRAVDAGNDTSRLGTPSQGAKNMFGNDTGVSGVPDSQTATAVKAGATAGAEEGAEVGGVEAVGSVLDAIPGLDILGGILGVAGIAMGVHSEDKAPTVAPPVKQPVGVPSSGIAFDSAPVFDSSDYHSL